MSKFGLCVAYVALFWRPLFHDYFCGNELQRHMKFSDGSFSYRGEKRMYCSFAGLYTHQQIDIICACQYVNIPASYREVIENLYTLCQYTVCRGLIAFVDE